MKKQRYIVEIEMPDGDFISAGWLKDLIQTDCDVEDESRKKVTVQETSLPSNLDEAAEEYGRKEYSHAIHFWDEGLSKNKPEVMKEDFVDAFKAGAEWMAGQGGEIKGWLARHRNGELCLFFNKPEYKLHIGWVDEHQHWRVIDANLFPEIKFKDSPIEVIINIRKK